MPVDLESFQLAAAHQMLKRLPSSVPINFLVAPEDNDCWQIFRKDYAAPVPRRRLRIVAQMDFLHNMGRGVLDKVNIDHVAEIYGLRLSFKTSPSYQHLHFYEPPSPAEAFAKTMLDAWVNKKTFRVPRHLPPPPVVIEAAKIFVRLLLHLDDVNAPILQTLNRLDAQVVLVKVVRTCIPKAELLRDKELTQLIKRKIPGTYLVQA